ncbi:hypothetical protein ACFTY8_03270 [Streptomyces mirabilis]|uniref:hypothetical protein n=1 Tax=Streptomyces mirabilis TaxID=68239 RepID=UPI0036413FF1
MSMVIMLPMWSASTPGFEDGGVLLLCAAGSADGCLVVLVELADERLGDFARLLARESLDDLGGCADHGCEDFAAAGGGIDAEDRVKQRPAWACVTGRGAHAVDDQLGVSVPLGHRAVGARAELHEGFRDPHDILAELFRIRLGHSDILPTRPTGQASSDVTRSCGRPSLYRRIDS